VSGHVLTEGQRHDVLQHSKKHGIPKRGWSSPSGGSTKQQQETVADRVYTKDKVR